MVNKVKINSLKFTFNEETIKSSFFMIYCECEYDEFTKIISQAKKNVKILEVITW